jgi:hypothetical protein
MPAVARVVAALLAGDRLPAEPSMSPPWPLAREHAHCCEWWADELTQMTPADARGKYAARLPAVLGLRAMHLPGLHAAWVSGAACGKWAVG